MSTIIIQQSDGSIALTTCADGVDVEKHAEIVAAGRPFRIVDDADLPDRRLVDAWVDDGSSVTIDPDKVAHIHAEDVKQQRAAAYPSIGDQLDAIWKQLNVLRMQKKLDLIEEADDMLGRILAVKREVPKE